jgi:hypothetical protein
MPLMAITEYHAVPAIGTGGEQLEPSISSRRQSSIRSRASSGPGVHNLPWAHSGPGTTTVTVRERGTRPLSTTRRWLARGRVLLS